MIGRDYNLQENWIWNFLTTKISIVEYDLRGNSYVKSISYEIYIFTFNDKIEPHLFRKKNKNKN